MFALATAPAAPAAPSLPAGFEEGTVAELGTSGVGTATEVAWTPDGRMLITDKSGRLWVQTPSGPQLVLDLSHKVNDYRDRGLLGMAVDKDFATNNWVYLLYTREPDALNPDEFGATSSRLTRITLNDDNTVAAGGAETVILGKSAYLDCPAASNASDCIPADHDWHTIGTVRVDPVDGTLWVGSGDGSYSYVVNNQTIEVQDEASYRGKVLHVDRNGKGLPGHPFCPGNTNYDDVCTKVYAKGFRNPFRFAVRPGKGPVVGDVGADHWEEVNLLKPGANHGWPCYEGNGRQAVWANSAQCQTLYAKEGTVQAASKPSYTYAHSGTGASALGGPAYAGSNYPAAYRGSIFVADYARGWVKRLKVDAADKVVSVEPFASYPSGYFPTFIDIIETPSGNIGYLDAGWGNEPWQGGYVKEFRYSPTNASPVARATGLPLGGPDPLPVDFDARASTDANGDALIFDWTFGDGTNPPPGVDATPSHTYTGEGPYTATVTVTDGKGGSSAASVGPITPGNTAPVPRISAPADGARFRYGRDVSLSGTADDAEDAGSPSLEWTIRQQHGNHKHDFTKLHGPSPSFYPGNDHDVDSHLIVTLTATDSKNIKGSTTIHLNPEETGLTLASVPSGAPVAYGPFPFTAPVTRGAAMGFLTEVSAAQTFTRNGATYVFERWSDDGARQHQLTIPARAATLTATYNGVPTARAVRLPASGAAPLTVAFDARGSHDPDGRPLGYDWDFGDGANPPAGADPAPRHTYTAPGEYRATLTVIDGRTSGRHTIGLPPVVVTRAPDPRLSRLDLRLPKRKRLDRRGRVTLRAVNAGPVAWRGKVELRTTGKVRTGARRKRRVTLGRKSVSLDPGAARKVTIRLSRGNRRLVAKLRRVKVTAWIAPDGGSPARDRSTTLLRAKR